MLEKKIIHYLYNIMQRRQIKKFMYPYSIENPLEYLYASDRYKGFDVSQKILSYDSSISLSDNDAILERILKAYKLSKKDQPTSGPYSVSGMWYENLQFNYKHLLDLSSNATSMNTLNEILSNLFRQDTTGLSASGNCPAQGDTEQCEKYINRYLNNLVNLGIYLGIPYIQKNMDSEFFLFDEKIDPAKLFMDICEKVGIKAEYPKTGNPFGFKMQTPDGEQVIPHVAFRHLYLALKVLKLNGSKDSARIMEIGGGFGGVSYFTNILKSSSLIFWSLDLPEINIISSFFLIKSLPDVEVVLYGEDDVDPNNKKNVIYILPNWEMQNIKQNSIDITFNSDSMPEMPKATVEEYLSKISDFSEYFYSYNQDCGVNDQTRLTQIDTNPLGLENLSSHIAWLRPGFFERLYKSTRYVK